MKEVTAAYIIYCGEVKISRPVVRDHPARRTRGARGKETGMTIFVTEINGLRIFAFSQATMGVAQALADDEDFRADLMFLQGEDGRPLWDGYTEIYVREADPEEAEGWNAGRSPSASRQAGSGRSSYGVQAEPASRQADSGQHASAAAQLAGGQLCQRTGQSITSGAACTTERSCKTGAATAGPRKYASGVSGGRAQAGAASSGSGE